MKLAGLLAIQILILFTGCAAEQGDSSPRVDSDLMLVESVVEDYTLNTVNSFVDNVDQLNQQSQSMCQNADNEVSLEDLRAAWEKAMSSFHRSEVLVYSLKELMLEEDAPLGFIYTPLPSLRAANSIRKEIALIDEQEGSEKKYSLLRPRSQLLGLNALEALFFEILKEQDVVAPGSGDCVYLTFVTEDLMERAQNYREQWLVEELAAVQSTNGRTKVQATIRQLTTHIISYVDTRLKNKKIAIPVGLKQYDDLAEAKKARRKETVEHPYFPNKKIALLEPLLVLDRLFNAGGEKQGASSFFGFRSYLENQRKNKALFQNADILALLAMVKELPDGPAYEELFSSSADAEVAQPVLDIFSRTQNFTEWLKVDFLVEMQANLPKAVQGDND